MKQQYMQWVNSYSPVKATIEENGWSGWFVEKNDGSDRIFLTDKTYEEAVNVANKYNKELDSV